VPEYSSGYLAEGQVSIPWPVAYYFMDRWLKDFAFRIDTGIWTFVLSDVLALVIAFLTVSCHIYSQSIYAHFMPNEGSRVSRGNGDLAVGRFVRF